MITVFRDPLAAAFKKAGDQITTTFTTATTTPTPGA